MLTALRKRLDARDEKGFTLIELLVVIIIIGILLAIAVPSYLGFRDRATTSANQANVRAGIPSLEVYFADNNGTATDSDANAATIGYTGLNWQEVQEVDAGFSPNVIVAGGLQSDGVTTDALAAPTDDSYCVYTGSGTFLYSYSIGTGRAAGDGKIVQAVCP